MASKASAVWTGSLKEGKGTISTATGVLKDANYSFATRFEGADSGTTPEELIAAAHASCFSMALGAQLWAAPASRPTRLKPTRPSPWPKSRAASPSPRSRSPPPPAFPAPPRKPSTRPPPTPRPAAPSPSSSPTTPKSRSTPSWSKCRPEAAAGQSLFSRGRLGLALGGRNLTHAAAFARLRVAAGSVENAGLVYRAEVAELADARGSGPRTRKGVGVRVPSSAPNLFESVV